MALRAVLDTNVIYAGLRSRRGASFQILNALWQRKWTLLLNQTLLSEYEEVLKRDAHGLHLSLRDIEKVLDALCVLAERHSLQENWLPVLKDPDDEVLVQLAVHARADHLVSHNIHHLAPARNLGLSLLEPKDFLVILRT